MGLAASDLASDETQISRAQEIDSQVKDPLSACLRILESNLIQDQIKLEAYKSLVKLLENLTEFKEIVLSQISQVLTGLLIRNFKSVAFSLDLEFGDRRAEGIGARVGLSLATSISLILCEDSLGGAFESEY